MNSRQRALLSGFAANLSVLLVGYGMSEQPLATLPMTWKLRMCIMVSSAGFLILAFRSERSERGNR